VKTIRQGVTGSKRLVMHMLHSLRRLQKQKGEKRAALLAKFLLLVRRRKKESQKN